MVGLANLLDPLNTYLIRYLDQLKKVKMLLDLQTMGFLLLLIPKVKLLNKLVKKDILMLIKSNVLIKLILLNTVIRSSFILS